MEYMKRKDYEAWIASTRDARMDWWRKARFGMFVHFGLYSILGRHEWVMSMEGIDKEDYEKLADQFLPEEGCCEKWAKLAKKAGMKYMAGWLRERFSDFPIDFIDAREPFRYL